MTQTHRDSPEMVARIDAVLDDIAETAEYQRDGGADYAEPVHNPNAPTFTHVIELTGAWAFDPEWIWPTDPEETR